MGRSVSRPSNAAQVLYAYFETEDDDEDSPYWWFQESIKGMRECLIARYPSLTKCDEWIGYGQSEDHALLENRHAYIGVSEYCGLVSIWIVPKDDKPALAAQWCSQVKLEDAAECFGQRLVKEGTMSNGEGVFRRAA